MGGVADQQSHPVMPSPTPSQMHPFLGPKGPTGSICLPFRSLLGRSSLHPVGLGFSHREHVTLRQDAFRPFHTSFAKQRLMTLFSLIALIIGFESL